MDGGSGWSWQGNEDVAQAFASEGSQELHGPEVLADMKEYLRLLIMCMHFSKKPFPGFLKATGLTPDQVLLEEGKAGVCDFIQGRILSCS